MMEWQWHQLEDTQIICTSLQTRNHASTSPLIYFTGRMLFLTLNQWCQSTEDKITIRGTDEINKTREELTSLVVVECPGADALVGCLPVGARISGICIHFFVDVLIISSCVLDLTNVSIIVEFFLRNRRCCSCSNIYVSATENN